VRTRAVLLAFVACAALAGSAAAAETQPRLLEANAGPALTDGRYVWFTVYPGPRYEPRQPIRLLDTRKGTDQAIAAPAGCDSSPTPSIRRVLFVCDDSPRYRLLDLDSGAVAPVDADSCRPPARQSYADNYGHTRFQLVGRHWLSGTWYAGSDVRGRAYLFPIFFNWRTGECRSFETAAEGWRDTDDPDLPMRRTPRCGRRGVAFTIARGSGQPQVPLAIRLCRERRTVRIRCKSSCEFATLRSGVVAWTERNVVKVQVLATGRRHGWRFPDHYAGSGYSSVFADLAGRTLVVSSAQPEPGHFHVYAADVPG
jgi:hypothetical protein